MRRIDPLPPLHPPHEHHGRAEEDEALREAQREIALGDRIVKALLIVLGLLVAGFVAWWLTRGR